MKSILQVDLRTQPFLEFFLCNKTETLLVKMLEERVNLVLCQLREAQTDGLIELSYIHAIVLICIHCGKDLLYSESTFL